MSNQNADNRPIQAVLRDFAKLERAKAKLVAQKLLPETATLKDAEAKLREICPPQAA